MKYCNKSNHDNQSDTITIQELEQMRKKIITKLHNCRIVLIIVIILFVSFTLLSIFLIKKNVNLIVLLIYIITMIVIISIIANNIINIIYIQNESKFSKHYKELITKKVFETNFPHFLNFTYMPEKCISKHRIIMTDLIEFLNTTFEGNDYIKATYNNVTFEYSDILVERKKDVDDFSDRRCIHFQGQWFILNLNKNVGTNIKIYNTNSTIVTTKSIFSKYHLVKLEDIKFNKKMKVYAENPSDVFYILTPQLIEKLTYLENQFNDELLFCFTENKLHIAFNSGTNSLDPDFYVPIDENHLQKATLKIKQEMQIVMDIIDILQQNNNYFGK